MIDNGIQQIWSSGLIPFSTGSYPNRYSYGFEQTEAGIFGISLIPHSGFDAVSYFAQSYDGEYLLEDDSSVVVDQSASEKDQLCFEFMDDSHGGAVWLDEVAGDLILRFKSFLFSGTEDPAQPAVAVESGINEMVRWPSLVLSTKNVYTTWNANYRIPTVQQIDYSTGEPMWGDDGLMLVNAPIVDNGDTIQVSYQNTELLGDGEGGVITATTGYYLGLEFQGEVRIQHVNSSGDLLWGENGVRLDDHAKPYPSCLPMALLPGGGGYILYQCYPHGIKLQRFDSEGQPQWESEGEMGVLVSQSHLPPRGYVQVVDDDGSAIVITTDYVPVDGYFAQRYSQEGEPVWENRVYLGEDIHEYHTHFDALPLPGGDALFIGLKNSPGTGESLYAQRLTTEGEVLWGEEGVTLFGIGDVIFPWFSISGCAVEDGFWAMGASEEHFYIQKFQLDGTAETGLIELPQIVRPTGEGHPELISDSEGGVYVLWSDIESPTPHQAWWLHFRENGEFMHPEYEEEPNILTHNLVHDMETGSFDQMHSTFVAESDQEGGVLAVWVGDRPEMPLYCRGSVYAQRFNDFVESTLLSHLEQPYVFALKPAYPNPFNPATQLAFTLPQAGKATLTVYDVLGREVARLVDGRMDAGRHTVTWDATGSTVASGTYFCRLESDGQMAVQKLILLK